MIIDDSSEIVLGGGTDDNAGADKNEKWPDRG